jgi:hypothetical protein
MNRPIGVTLLAIGAGLATLFQIWRILVFLGIVSFTFVGKSVSFSEPQWGQALWGLILAAIWAWVAVGFWNVRAYAWSFGNFISLFTIIFGFFAIITGNGTTESEMVGWLLAIAIFFYLNYPGVRNAFMEHELSLLSPEQRAAIENLERANAAAAAAMTAPGMAAPAVAAPAAAAPAAAAPAAAAPAPAAPAPTAPPAAAPTPPPSEPSDPAG